MHGGLENLVYRDWLFSAKMTLQWPWWANDKEVSTNCGVSDELMACRRVARPGSLRGEPTTVSAHPAPVVVSDSRRAIRVGQRQTESGDRTVKCGGSRRRVEPVVLVVAPLLATIG